MWAFNWVFNHPFMAFLWYLLSLALFSYLVKKILRHIDIQLSASGLGIRDCGEVEKDVFGNRARHSCKQVVRLGSYKNSYTDNAVLRYCWQCQCTLSNDVVTSPQPTVLALPPPTPITTNVVTFPHKEERMKLKRKKNTRGGNDPPSAA